MATRSSPVIVGRSDELARIDRAFETAAAGQPVLGLVRGEAGIGKSRLVREAMDRARSRGSLVLHGACLDLGGEGLPYLPLVEGLRGLARDVSADRLRSLLGPARADLATLLPELGEMRSAASDAPGAAGGRDVNGPGEARVDRARLFERFIGFLGRLGQDVPALAVVEDVQWIDPATRDLITYLAHSVTNERLVAILTCRTDDLPPGHPVLAWLAQLSRVPGSMRIDLGRLRRRDIVQQLQAIVGGDLDDGVVDAIWRRSEGHPLFAEELLATGDNGGTEMPSLLEVLLGRIATLDQQTLPVVETLAVASRPVDERLIGPLVERTEREVGAALRQATARGVLVALPDGRHAFRHELLREVVEGQLSAAERRDLHERFARRLEERPDLADDSPAGAAGELAHHWAAADRPVEAFRAAVAAAEAADAVHAFADAQRLFERAIRLENALPLDDLPTDATRIELRRRAADAADLAGQFEAASVHAVDALALLDASASPALAGLLHSRLGYFAWARGRAAQSLDEHREAVRLVPEEPPSTERARVLAGLGGALMGLGRWAESKPVCEAAIDCAARAGAPLEESRARNMLGSDLVALGDVDAGLGELRESHRLAVSGPTELQVVTAFNLALNLLAADRLDESLVEARGALEIAREGGLERRYGMDTIALIGDALLRLGRWDEADSITLEGLALDQRGRGTAYLATVRSRLLADRGDLDEADRRLGAIDVDAQDPDTAAFVERVKAELELNRGRPADAAAAAERGLARLDDVLWGIPLVAFGLRAVAEIAETARAAHDDAAVDAATRRASSFSAKLDDMSPRAQTPGTRAWIDSARMERRRIEGRAEQRGWDTLATTWDAVPDRLEAAYARYRSAEAALRESGVRADVGPGLRAASAATRAMGARPLESAITGLARRARISVDEQVTAGGHVVQAAATEPAAAAAPGGLSPREVEVLRLVAAGRSNGEIAERLFITRKTAGVHVTHILDKLGVSNRVEAAMAAARLGLLPDDEEA